MNGVHRGAHERETEVAAAKSELLCGTGVARSKGTQGVTEMTRPILIGKA